jgi:hypothetical protein
MKNIDAAELRRTISNLLIGIVAVSFLAFFGLDGMYASKPHIPDPLTGRVIPHSIKWHGYVYLTAREDALYGWIVYVIIACAALLLLVNLAEYFMSKSRRARKIPYDGNET